MTTDRRLVFAVVGFLGASAAGCLVALVLLIFLLLVRRTVLGAVVGTEEIALLGLISTPMGTALGFVGGVLVNTRTEPTPGPVPGTPPPYQPPGD